MEPAAESSALTAVSVGADSSSVPEAPSYADELAEELAEAETERLAAEAHAAAIEAAELPPDRFLDREASWLDFNARVLDLAADENIPLLERLRFLAIFSSNLDEFFMVRVAGLRRRLATGIAVVAPSGLELREQLQLIMERTRELMGRQVELYHEHIRPELEAAGVTIASWADLDKKERKSLRKLFTDRVYPVLTPLAVDPAHPFPYISGLSLNLAVVVRDPDNGREHFARVKVPPLLPRFVPVGNGRYVPLEDVISAQLPELFPGLEIVETYCFRVTRNEDLEVDSDEVENLLDALEQELQRRRFGVPVRLEVEEGMSKRVLELLMRELGVTKDDVLRLPRPLALAGLFPLADLERPELRWPGFVPATPEPLRDEEGKAANVFTALRQGDVVVHHPYESFATSVQAFVEQAAADPNVLAIKQTLYRTSGDSPVVDALIDAAEAGKQVLVLVELKARFDEKANIRWARQLEQAGCHVVYGIVGLKTHCKLCLVVRQEDDGTLRRYVHVGTGNYNPKTARIYEDVGLLSADPVLTEDVANLFNHLSGYTRHRDYADLLVAPDTLRSGLLALINRERKHAIKGRPAHITMKFNALVDEEVIDALYVAAQAGVEVDLVVRGMCALRPGVPGLSEKIRVRSILGRFLEHSRLVRFANAGDEEVWIGSADAMHRNLDRRVEAMVRVTEDAARERLSRLLDLAISDRIACWTLDGTCTWSRRKTDEDGNALHDYQELLIAGHGQVPDLDALAIASPTVHVL
ncbi:MAG: polyphosphate kinase [Frankiales bacterium]|jgi:polyphosphate kinase|nr:polyphosphate kinase [Frankiales bacterium]